MSWIVAMTKPNLENTAVENLKRQGYEFYCPKILVKLPNKPAVIRSLFPRYLFVLIHDTWYSLKGTYGISYILMGESSPQIIPDAIIEGLKAREDSKGYFQLVAPEKFHKGQALKTLDGPLAGIPLIYEGMSSRDRVKALATMLGRQVLVELSESALVAA